MLRAASSAACACEGSEVVLRVDIELAAMTVKEPRVAPVRTRTPGLALSSDSGFGRLVAGVTASTARLTQQAISPLTRRMKVSG